MGKGHQGTCHHTNSYKGLVIAKALLSFLVAAEAQEEVVILAGWDTIPRRRSGQSDDNITKQHSPGPAKFKPRAILPPQLKMERVLMHIQGITHKKPKPGLIPGKIAQDTGALAPKHPLFTSRHPQTSVVIQLL